MSALIFFAQISCVLNFCSAAYPGSPLVFFVAWNLCPQWPFCVYSWYTYCSLDFLVAVVLEQEKKTDKDFPACIAIGFTGLWASLSSFNNLQVTLGPIALSHVLVEPMGYCANSYAIALTTPPATLCLECVSVCQVMKGGRVTMSVSRVIMAWSVLNDAVAKTMPHACIPMAPALVSLVGKVRP